MLYLYFLIFRHSTSKDQVENNEMGCLVAQCTGFCHSKNIYKHSTFNKKPKKLVTFLNITETEHCLPDTEKY